MTHYHLCTTRPTSLALSSYHTIHHIIIGQQTIRSYWRNYYEQTDGLVWVIDSADGRRLLDCKAELQKLLLQEKLAGASLLILANKQDLPGALTHEEIAKGRECYSAHTLFGSSCASLVVVIVVIIITMMCLAIIVLELDTLKDRHWKIVACSAVSGAGLIDGVDWVVTDIASRIYTLA
jgi:ADP-ribosylation factor-like protein 2